MTALCTQCCVWTWFVCKGKVHHTPWREEVECSSPFLRPLVHRWINHSDRWCMASAMPDRQLPSQLQGITTPWLVLLGDRGTCVQTTCPRLLSESGISGNQTCDHLSCESNALTITPEDHIRNPLTDEKDGWGQWVTIRGLRSVLWVTEAACHLSKPCHIPRTFSSKPRNKPRGIGQPRLTWRKAVWLEVVSVCYVTVMK